MHTYTHTCAKTHVRKNTRTQAHTHMYTRAQTHTHPHTNCTYIHTHTNTQTYTHTHAQTNKHTHTRPRTAVKCQIWKYIVTDCFNHSSAFVCKKDSAAAPVYFLFSQKQCFLVSLLIQLSVGEWILHPYIYVYVCIYIYIYIYIILLCLAGLFPQISY